MENTLRFALAQEVKHKIQEYELACDRGIRLLQDARGRSSTHTGHNLASVAQELAVAAAKVEMAQNVLASLGEFGIE